jgi:hypothetical protein
MRLFFDVIKQQCPRYDFHGRDFSRTEEAAQMAELIAVDLGCSETDNWVGSVVTVRNSTGETLYTFPVLMAD